MWVVLLPRRHSAAPAHILVSVTVKVLPSSRGWKPGMLLNILKCTRDTANVTWYDVLIVPKLRQLT